MKIKRTIVAAVFGALGIGAPPSASAEEVVAAVTSNFYATLKSLKEDFELSTGNTLTIVNGTTAQLKAQVEQGAPYDILLAVNETATRELVEDGLAVRGTEFVYAVGVLALYSSDRDRTLDDGISFLKSGAYTALALTGSTAGPYGAAAWSMMNAMGIADSLGDKVVVTKDTEGTAKALESNVADLAFVPYSALVGEVLPKTGAYWIVPSDLHKPINQTAVLLERGKDSKGAKALLEFLQSPGAIMSIRAAGYILPGR